MIPMGPPAKAPRLFIASPAPPEEEVVPLDWSGVVLGSRIENAEVFYTQPELPIAKHPEPHRGYMMASRVLTATAGLLSIGSVVTACFGLKGVAAYTTVWDQAAMDNWLISMFFGFTIAEAFCCLIAMLTCFCLLMKRPYKVLIRSPQHGSFVCLCFTIFLLGLFALYSVSMQIVCALWAAEHVPSPALCVIPAVRACAIFAFFGILLVNSRVLPQDPLF